MPKVMKFQRDLKKKAKKQGIALSEGIPADPLAPNEGSLPPGVNDSMNTAPALPQIPPGVAESTPEEVGPGVQDAAPPVSAQQQIAEIARTSKYKIGPQKNENFDAFRKRALPMVRAAMQELAHDPTKYIPVIMQSQAIKMVDAWLAAGMPDDFSINHEAMGPDPGAVERLYPVPEAPGWRKEAVQNDQPLPPPPGILLIRHGAGDAAGYAQTGKQQDAIAELAKHVKSGDFGRARAFAHKASAEMGVSDDDINAIIDRALPSPEEAADLPHDRLLAVASAAHGSAKFPEYAALLRERFGNLEGLPPVEQQKLLAHLGALGV